MHRHYSKITNKYEYVYYLDEKWFYTTNHRNKLKNFLKGQHEGEGVVTFLRPKIMSRRFPVKLMFLGVFGRPLPHGGFDGTFLLERVSE